MHYFKRSTRYNLFHYFVLVIGLLVTSVIPSKAEAAPPTPYLRPSDTTFSCTDTMSTRLIVHEMTSQPPNFPYVPIDYTYPATQFKLYRATRDTNTHPLGQGFNGSEWYFIDSNTGSDDFSLVSTISGPLSTANYTSGGQLYHYLVPTVKASMFSQAPVSPYLFFKLSASDSSGTSPATPVGVAVINRNNYCDQWKIYRVGPDGTASTLPAGTGVSKTSHTTYNTLSNPFLTSSTWQGVYIAKPSNFNVQVTQCGNDIGATDCSINSANYVDIRGQGSIGVPNVVSASIQNSTDIANLIMTTNSTPLAPQTNINNCNFLNCNYLQNGARGLNSFRVFVKYSPMAATPIITAQAGSAGGGSVDVRVTNLYSGNILSHGLIQLYRSSSLNGTYNYIAGINPPSSGNAKYTDADLNPSTTYYYKAYLFDAYYYSVTDMSNVASAVPSATTSNIQVTRVDSTGSLFTDQPTTVSLNGSTASSSNPARYANITTNSSNSLVVSRPSTAYSVFTASCEYSGTTECNIDTSEITTPVICSGTSCTAFDVIGSAVGITKKVAVKYVVQPTTQIKAYRYGADLTTASAPAGSQPITIPNVGQSNSNPFTVSVDPADFSFTGVYMYSSFLSGYAPMFGQCVYNTGSTECIINESDLIYTGTMSYPSGAASGSFFNQKTDNTLSLSTTWKAAIVYFPLTAPTVTTSTTCDGKVNVTFPNNPAIKSYTIFRFDPSTGTTRSMVYVNPQTTSSTYTFVDGPSTATYPFGTSPSTEYRYTVSYNADTIGTQGFSTAQSANVTSSPECAPTTSSLRVTRVDSTGSLYTLPSTASLNGGTPSNSNPSTFSSIVPASTNTVTVSRPDTNTSVYAASCEYSGTTECNINLFAIVTPAVCSGLTCTFSNVMGSASGLTKKLAVMYTDETTCANGATNPPTCTCPLGQTEVAGICTPDTSSLLVTRVDSTGSLYTLPSTASLNGGTPSNSNPSTFSSIVPASTNTVTVSRPDTNTSVYAASCEYSGTTECNINLFAIVTPAVCSGLTCTFSNVMGSASGLTKKLAVMYTDETTCANGATNPPTCTCPLGQTEVAGICTPDGVGSIKITRYGADGLWPSTAPSGTSAKVDSLTPKTANPADYNNISVGAHISYATDVSGYVETVGTCSYVEGGTECNVNASNFASVDCDGNHCIIPTSVTLGMVTKVAVKYTSDTTCPNGATNYPTCSICTPPATMVNGNCSGGDDGGGNSCPNGATNWPTCTTNGGGDCVNGATNPPSCTICPSPKIMVDGLCVNTGGPSTDGPVAIDTFKPAAPVNSGSKCTLTWQLKKYNTNTTCLLTGHGLNYVYNPNTPATPATTQTNNITSDSAFTLSCNDGLGLAPVTKVAVCRLVANVKETEGN